MTDEEMQDLKTKVDDIHEFITMLRDGMSEMLNQGGMQAMMMRQMVPPNILQTLK